MSEVNAYIEKQKIPNKEIITKLNIIIENLLGSAVIKGGVPCYGISKENPYGLCYIVGLKDHVNIGFLVKKLKPEQVTLLRGTGKTMKVLEIKSIAGINELLITKLLKSLK